MTPRKLPRSTLRPSSEPKVPVAPIAQALTSALSAMIEEQVRAQVQAARGPDTGRVRVSEAPRPEPSPQQKVFTRHVMQALNDAELTPQEINIALMVLRGLTNEQIAEAAELSQKTVKHHVGSIFRKFHVDSRAQLTARIFPI